MDVFNRGPAEPSILMTLSEHRLSGLAGEYRLCNGQGKEGTKETSPDTL